jgi:hypothetical protein
VDRFGRLAKHVVKALNTIVGHVLAKGTPLDAFTAGDSPEA